jgi:hypothetical protein
MTRYRVICTVQEPASAHPKNAKIVAVGTIADGTVTTRRWTIQEVVNAMDHGDYFYTRGETSQRVASVEKYWCAICNAWHIRSTADAVTDNNLDSLRRCS